MRCAELLVHGRAEAERALCLELGRHRTAARAVLDEILGWELVLTGAEVVAVLLAEAGVADVFVYAGTSELALCDAVCDVQGVRLINGRGDKESAFMAAGASLLEANRAAAILHGARGLTNAGGGVADACRNEAGTMYVVGLPSSGSARFLPPHGEADLLTAMGTFADWAWQAPPVPDDAFRRRQAARRFVAQLRDGLASTAEPPSRPAIFGLPQDVAEQRWINLDELASMPAPRPASDLAQPAMDAAVHALRHAERPLVLLDDYALRYPGIRGALDRLSRAVGAGVLQLRYRRGPMMFERLRDDEVANFLGWLNQFSPAHAGVLDACDLLVTVEDRNLYQRVVGTLPPCRKIAINTDPEKVLKNEYLGHGDPLIVGNPAEIVAELADRLGRPEEPGSWVPDEARAAAGDTPEPADRRVEHGRRGVVRALASVLARWERPVLVDDSQMFGGLLSEHYDEFPRGLRVFGGHGGFVGGGLSYATGLAIANQQVRVLCTLGDQAFTNSIQGLVAALQERAPVLFVVCNNGQSVSLNKQAAASFGDAPRPYLNNVEGLNYRGLAESLGIPAHRVEVPVGAPEGEVDEALTQLSQCLDAACATPGPALIELVLPSDPEAWRGIWVTQGFEQKVAVRL